MISFLNAVYGNPSKLPMAKERYEQASAELEHAPIAAQLYHKLEQAGALGQVPDFFRNKLQAEFEQALLQNMYIRSEELSLWRRLDSIRLETVSLKGTRFAERCFGHLAARGTSDIDLLVRSQDLQKVIAELQRFGYRMANDDDDDHYHVSLVKPIDANGKSLRVELHWSLVKEHSSSLGVERLWNEAEPIEGFSYAKELSIPHTFYAICLHGANHRMDSLKHVLDIVQMAERFSDQIDYRKLFEQARDDLLYRRVRFALSVAYRLFPHLQRIKPFKADGVSRLWSYSMIANRRGGGGRVRFFLFVALVYVWVYDRWHYRFDAVRQLLFKPNSKLGRAGKYLRRSKV